MIDIHVHSKQMAKDKLEFLKCQADNALLNKDTELYEQVIEQINEVQKEIMEYGLKDDKDSGRQNACEGSGEQEDNAIWDSIAGSESGQATDRNSN